jgi:spoIIIJ-associated protein
MSYIEVTGKTEEEALAKALSQLGLDRDEVSVEILERSKSGFLGIGSTPAKIRVTYGEEESAAVAEPAAAPKVPVSDAAACAPAAPAAAESEKAEAPAAASEEEAPADDERAARIHEFLGGLMKQLESGAVARVYPPDSEDRYRVVLEGEHLGNLIGRRGETLDAIQQLTNYAVNHGADKRVRVHVDAENYRAKREESLKRLAEKVAGKAVKYRRDMMLEPMNAYERHVIHAALQDDGRVTTQSTGTEPNRRVVIKYLRDR